LTAVGVTAGTTVAGTAEVGNCVPVEVDGVASTGANAVGNAGGTVVATGVGEADATIDCDRIDNTEYVDAPSAACTYSPFGPSCIAIIEYPPTTCGFGPVSGPAINPAVVAVT
jgi:hypothetical protein